MSAEANDRAGANGPEPTQLSNVLKYLTRAEVTWKIDAETVANVKVQVGKSFDKTLYERNFTVDEFDQIASWTLDAGKKALTAEPFREDRPKYRDLTK